MSDADRGRVLRRRHMHERQAVVFGVLLAGLAVAGVGAAAVYTDTINLGVFDRGFSSPAPTATTADQAVCPPAGALPVSYDQITVTVLNGSGAAGWPVRRPPTWPRAGSSSPARGTPPPSWTAPSACPSV
ncbi:hypothetical protein [Cellulomonas soli]